MSFATNLHHQAVERFLQLKKKSGSPGTGAPSDRFFCRKILEIISLGSIGGWAVHK
jgi:hypothetical protein